MLGAASVVVVVVLDAEVLDVPDAEVLDVPDVLDVLDAEVLDVPDVLDVVDAAVLDVVDAAVVCALDAGVVLGAVVVTAEVLAGAVVVTAEVLAGAVVVCVAGASVVAGAVVAGAVVAGAVVAGAVVAGASVVGCAGVLGAVVCGACGLCGPMPGPPGPRRQFGQGDIGFSGAAWTNPAFGVSAAMPTVAATAAAAAARFTDIPFCPLRLSAPTTSTTPAAGRQNGDPRLPRPALWAGHVHLERLAHLLRLLRVALVGTRRSALDRVGLAVRYSSSIAGLARCGVGVTQRDAVDIAQSDRMNNRRIVIADHRADPVCRITNADGDIAAAGGASDLTSDVLFLTVDDDLRASRAMAR